MKWYRLLVRSQCSVRNHTSYVLQLFNFEHFAQLFGQGKENEYEDDVTVVRGPPGPAGKLINGQY